MAKRRKHNLHAVDEELDVQAIPTETLDDFLRDVHQETTVSASSSIGDKEVVGVGSGGEKVSIPAVEVAGVPSLKFLKENFQTKSAAIRYLHENGHKVGTIAKHLGVRYQHVRNVLTTQLKRGPNESHQIAQSPPKPLTEFADGDD